MSPSAWQTVRASAYPLLDYAGAHALVVTRDLLGERGEVGKRRLERRTKHHEGAHVLRLGLVEAQRLYHILPLVFACCEREQPIGVCAPEGFRLVGEVVHGSGDRIHLRSP